MKESEAKSSPSESCGITSALFTDFYELTMAQGYWKEKMNRPTQQPKENKHETNQFELYPGSGF